jgi:hypothetical protein
VITFLLLAFVPIGISAARYYWMGEGRGNWQTADRSSAGSIFGVHTWIVVKEQGANFLKTYFPSANVNDSSHVFAYSAINCSSISWSSVAMI